MRISLLFDLRPIIQGNKTLFTGGHDVTPHDKAELLSGEKLLMYFVFLRSVLLREGVSPTQHLQKTVNTFS